MRRTLLLTAGAMGAGFIFAAFSACAEDVVRVTPPYHNVTNESVVGIPLPPTFIVACKSEDTVREAFIRMKNKGDYKGKPLAGCIGMPMPVSLVQVIDGFVNDPDQNGLRMGTYLARIVNGSTNGTDLVLINVMLGVMGHPTAPKPTPNNEVNNDGIINF